MEETILDDPENGKNVSRSHLLTWWTAGLSIGIGLLCLHYLSITGSMPSLFFLDEERLAILLSVLLVALASLHMARRVYRADPEVSAFQVGGFGLGAGFLGLGIYLFFEIMVARLQPEGFRWWLGLAGFCLICGFFSGIVASMWINIRNRKGVWVSVLLLVIWLLGVLVLSGMPKHLFNLWFEM